MSAQLRTTLLIGLVIAVAIWIGWMAARPPVVAIKSGDSAADGASSYKAGAKLNAESNRTPKPLPSGWVPPEGDPVQRYQGGKTPEERAEIMGAFMTLGHDHNGLMLIEALKDSNTRNRVSAVEYAAQLTEKVSAEVLKEAILNDQSDVREMAWSILAPHPLENKAPAFMATIERGNDVVLEESFREMGRTPEMPLFEAMLTSATKVQGERQARVFKELNQWLVPGGGNVPAFKSVNEVVTWWTNNKQRYDQFMLRVDQ
jgi:hypothetical protein